MKEIIIKLNLVMMELIVKLLINLIFSKIIYDNNLIYIVEIF